MRRPTLARVIPALLASAVALLLVLAPRASFAFTPNGAIDGFNPVAIMPEFPCNTEDVRLVFTICTCNARFQTVQRIDETHARLDIAVNPLVTCVQCQPDTLGLDLGRFPVGSHVMNAEIDQHVVAGPDSGQVRVEHFVLNFDVHGCPEPPNPLPYLTDVDVTAYCDTCSQAPCNDDSIYVRLEGMFTDPCYSVVELRALPNPSASPLPQPEIVRIVYEHACQACPAVLTPWSGALPIAPLPAGSYGLPIEVYLIDRCRGDAPELLGRSVFPFKVDTCGPPSTCAVVAFPSDLSVRCDAFVAPDRPGEAKLYVDAPVPVGGVQGRLVFDRPGLRVIGIDPVFPGTVLKWQAHEDGASFVVVLPQAIPIGTTAQGFPFINVRFALVPGASIDNLVRLTPIDVLVSDFNGVQIDPCASNTYGQPPALRICPAAGCDFNGDGRADVRDLVLMVNCLLHPPPNVRCAPPPDCNDDGHTDIDDVLCCARRILHGSPPDSSHAVPAPEVTLAFGTPVLVAGGVDLPLMVGGIGRIGATRLEFSYPDEAFASASVELNDASGHWLALDEASDGHAVFGGIRLSPEDAYGALPLTLHLRTRAGQQVAGSVSFIAGDFSDGNGATLVTSARPVTMPLGGGGNIALRAAWPNPFGAETHFGVGLAHAADLEIVVYDLAGRRVATLFKGLAAAGTHEITWRRTREDGSLVPSGIYFYRIVSGGEQQGGKLLVLARD